MLLLIFCLYDLGTHLNCNRDEERQDHEAVALGMARRAGKQRVSHGSPLLATRALERSGRPVSPRSPGGALVSRLLRANLQE